MNYPNKISRSLMVLGIVFSSACTDLKTDEVDSLVVNNAGGSATGNPGDLLTSAYKDLSTFADQQNVYALYEHTTDEMIPPTRGVDWGDNGVWRTLYQHTWDPNH